MSYYFTLRFPTEAEAFAAVESLALLPDPDPDADAPDLVVISQLGGKIFGQAMLIPNVMVPATYDQKGNELIPPRLINGTFVNVVLNGDILPASLRPYRVPYGSGGICWAGTEPEAGAWPPKGISLT